MRGVDDVLKNQLKCTDVSGIILPFNYDSKNDFSEIHILWPLAKISSLSHYGSWLNYIKRKLTIGRNLMPKVCFKK